MLKLEALRDELKVVSKEVKNHFRVAEKAGISLAYLTKIRKGTHVTIDNEKNQDLIKFLIRIYRQIGKKKINALEEAIKEK